jgi:unspecific monooxygenase
MNQPPTVEISPWLQLYQWIMNPLDFLNTYRGRYGECFTAQLGNFRNFVFFSNPKAIEQIFALTPSQADVGQGNQILRPTVGENSVLSLDGDRHQRQRQLLMPPFHGERMKAYGQLICEITEQVTRQWEVGKPFSVRPYMQEISLRIILKAVFGLNESQRYEPIRQLFGSFLDLTANPFGFALSLFPVLQRDFGFWSPGGRFLRLRQKIDEQIYAEIHERQENSDQNRTDILSLLIGTRDEAGQPMTDGELRDELMTLLLAGHETTATALSWAFYWLHQVPETKIKLIAELNTLGNESDPSAMNRLPYLNAVCLETLRICPVVFITPPRILKIPVQIGDYEFAPGTYLTPCIYLTHHREDLFPESNQFKPERFLERQFFPYEFLPFGGGNRRCIGAAFALFEMKLVLARILRNYDLETAETGPVVPIRRGVTIAPKGGVHMVMVEQRSDENHPSCKKSADF